MAQQDQQQQDQQLLHLINLSIKSHYLFKILLIGNSGVGKSCMLMRYSVNQYFIHQCINKENQFTNNFYNTIGVDFKIKTFQLDNYKIKMQIVIHLNNYSIKKWDTAGQDRFRTITSSYYRGAQGIMIVFDVTDRESFNNVQVWTQEIDKYANENVQRILVGNKCDVKERQIAYDEASVLGIIRKFVDMIAKNYGLEYIETSAKSDINVEQAFLSLTRKIVQVSGPPQEKKLGMRLGSQEKQKQQQNQKQEKQQDLCC